MLPKNVRLLKRLVLLAFFSIIGIAVVRAQGTVELFKGKTAIFLVAEGQLSFIDDYKKLLPQAWTLTPIEVIRWSDIDKYPEGDKYVFFVIHGSERSGISRAGNPHNNNQYYLTLSPNIVQDKKPGKDEFCRIELHSDHPTEWVNTKKDPIDRFYKDYTFPNFSLPYMMSYLRFMQGNMQSNKFPGQIETYIDKEMLKQLAGETLYIPETALGENETSTAKKGAARFDDVFKDAYEGKFQHVSDADLINVIKNNTSNKPIFVFEFVVSGINKHIGVVEITTGTVVYRRQVALSNTLKSHDVGKILK